MGHRGGCVCAFFYLYPAMGLGAMSGGYLNGTCCNKVTPKDNSGRSTRQPVASELQALSGLPES